MIPLSSASTYPTTEQTLASVSILLNGGGLAQLQEINQTFAKALAGRENDMRSLLTQLDLFIAQLNAQTDDIIAATESLNSLAGQVAAKDQTVDRALTAIPQALAVLADTRTKLADAIDALGKFSAIATSTVHQTKDALVSNLRNIAPVLRSLADAGPALTKGLDFLSTYPWVKSTIPNWFRGDFANITPGRRSDLEPAGQQLVHRDEVGRRPHRTRTAVGSHDRPDAEPVHRGQPADRPVPLGGLLHAAACPARCGYSWRSWRR